jgi:Flp pilus assembly protein TadG
VTLPRRRAEGFVAIEFLLAIAFLFLPVVLLVASLPQWSERQHAATAAADDAARVAIAAWPADSTQAATRAADDGLETYGVPPREVRVVVSPPPGRGGLLTVSVTIRMPALAVPLLTHAASWSWTATESRRIDDYRSR